MRRGWWILLAILAGIVWYFSLGSKDQERVIATGASEGLASDSPVAVGDAVEDIDSNSSEDERGSAARGFLRDVRLAESFLVQNRHVDSRHYSTVEQLELLMRKDGVIAPDEEFRDPWGSAYHVHPVSQGHIELRSAGPDRELYTEDDLVSM